VIRDIFQQTDNRRNREALSEKCIILAEFIVTDLPFSEEGLVALGLLVPDIEFSVEIFPAIPSFCKSSITVKKSYFNGHRPFIASKREEIYFFAGGSRL